MEYKSNRNIVYSCKYHVVWCPKYRRKLLVGDISIRLKEILIHTAQEINAEIIEMEIMPDHVHMLVDVDPVYGINKAVRHFKGRSARILRKEFHELNTKVPCMWTNSYFVSTCGRASLEKIKEYIQNQKRSERK